jgi:hypothetical protein
MIRRCFALAWRLNRRRCSVVSGLGVRVSAISRDMVTAGVRRAPAPLLRLTPLGHDAGRHPLHHPPPTRCPRCRRRDARGTPASVVRPGHVRARHVRLRGGDARVRRLASDTDWSLASSTRLPGVPRHLLPAPAQDAPARERTAWARPRSEPPSAERRGNAGRPPAPPRYFAARAPRLAHRRGLRGRAPYRRRTGATRATPRSSARARGRASTATRTPAT